ncbi:MAG: hypothetical protein WD342_03705 [Verrucomicrobiales bacterium]
MTNFATTLLTVSALALVSLSVGEETSKPRPGGKGDGSFFKSLDTDGDGAISKAEAGEKWQRLGRLDKDEDGKVTLAEMRQAGPGTGPGRPGGKRKGKGPGGEPGEFFKNADTNEDGKLSRDEVSDPLWSRISRLDKDDDNAVSREEFAAARDAGPGRGPGGTPRERFQRADANGDGKVSKDEVPEEVWTRMGRLDTDDDGAVTPEEFAAAGRMGRRGGPGAGGPAGPEAIFSRFDENEDGKLAGSEVPGEMWSRLSKADADADGLVSKDELREVYRRSSGSDGNRKKEARKPEGKPEETKNGAD